jgi:paired small multidrug resistance pump
MAWLAIVGAGVCEIFGVIGTKGVADHKGWKSYLLMALSFICSFTLLSYAMTSLSMGTAYAVWTGIGTVGSAIVGMLMFGEKREWKRMVFISIILVSAIGLKLIS